jgi:uncharacterized membrane protein YukC
LYIYILKIIGILIIVAVLAFAWALYVNASRLEKEIESEGGDSGKK